MHKIRIGLLLDWKSSFLGLGGSYAHVAVPVRKLTVNGVNSRLLFDGCQSRLCLVPVSSHCVGCPECCENVPCSESVFCCVPRDGAVFLSQLILYGAVHLDFIYCSSWRIGKSYTFINYATIHVVLRTLCIFFITYYA